MWAKISEILAFLFMAFAFLLMAFAVGGVCGMVVERTQLMHPRSAAVMAAEQTATSPVGPPAQAARAPDTLRRLPSRESSLPDPSIDRSLEAPESPTLMPDRAWEFTSSSYARNPLRTANVGAFERAPVVSEQPTGRSHGIPDLVFKNDPAAADRPASEEPDNSRFASRYDERPSETIPTVSEGWSHARFIETLPSETPIERSRGMPDEVSKNVPVAADRPASEVLDPSRSASRRDQIPSETSRLAPETTGSWPVPVPPQPRHVSSAPKRDPTMPWDQIDSRTDHIPSETMPLPSETTGSRRVPEPPQSRDASSASEQDHAMRWGPIDLRTREPTDDVALSKLVPRRATSPALSADKKRALEALQLGIELARQRSFYSSHARFIEALQIVAQSLDKLAFSNEHALALRRGLQAYEEAVDFQARSDQPDLEINLNNLIRGHDTSVLHHVNLDDWSWEQCLQEYMSVAEREIVHAVGREPLAAQALYGLGRLQVHLQPGNRESASVRTHRALMLYQAALIVDQGNYCASNELGVLLARNGQLEEAVTVLRHCVQLSPEPTAWQNLAVVHSRLGQAEQAELARRASEEARMAKNMNREPVVIVSGPVSPDITWSGWAPAE